MSATIQLQVTPPSGRPREESRVFVLLDAATERLPITFVGAAKALPAHQKTFDALVASVERLSAHDARSSPYFAWAE